MMKKKNKVDIMSSIELQDHLTEDLIMEILSPLPPITLLRFKSVSKTWYRLISNPDFRRRNTALYQFHRSSNRCRVHIDEDHHMLEEPSPPGILLRRGFCVGNSNIVIYPQSHGLDHEQKNLALLLQKLNDYRPAVNESSELEPPKLIDSCNGLLLYVHKFTRKDEEKKDIVCSTYHVCNPITNDCIKLPTLDMVVDIEEEQYKYDIAHIVFNPSFSLTYKVFIWIPCIKRSTSRPDPSHYYARLYVYSSSEASLSWRLSVSISFTEFPQIFMTVYNCKAVLWNGVLHWNTFPAGVSTDEPLFCYDIEKETVWKMKFPKMATGYTHAHRRLLYIGLCGERLLMIETNYCRNSFPSSFDVWEKKEQNSNENQDMWTVRYRVNFEEVDKDFYSKHIRGETLFNASSILDIYRTKNEEEEEEVMLMKVGSVGSARIIFFNLTSNTFGNKKLHNRKAELPPNIDGLKYSDILHYNVTLFPP